MKVFVYGSLKKGFYNHHILKDSPFVCTDVINNYSMVDLGSFPMALPDKNNTIIGEVYYITPETLERLDHLESEGSFYRRILVNGHVEENMFMYIGTHMHELQFENIETLNIWTKGFDK